MVCLALHGPYTSVLEEEPVVHFVPFSCSFGIANFVVLVILLHKVLHDRARLEEIDGFAI